MIIKIEKGKGLVIQENAQYLRRNNRIFSIMQYFQELLEGDGRITLIVEQ